MSIIVSCINVRHATKSLNKQDNSMDIKGHTITQKFMLLTFQIPSHAKNAKITLNGES